MGVLLLLLIIITYRSLISGDIVVGGDWPYYFNEYLQQLGVPHIWSPQWPYGLGGNQVLILPLKMYLQLPVLVFVNMLGFSWGFVSKAFWFWAFLGVSVFSSRKLTKSWIGVLIFTTNTWALLILDGGQMGIALSYAISSLVVYMCIRVVNAIKNTKTSVKIQKLIVPSLLLGLVLGFQLLLDFRIAYATVIVCFLYIVTFWFTMAFRMVRLLPLLIFSGLIAFLLNAFWIMPMAITGLSMLNQLGDVYTSYQALEFFSFVKYEQAITLLHPNWPENIFGKVSFIKPEFLLLGIIAFGSLLSLKTHMRKTLVFAAVALIGAFLAKGVQDPFGKLYYLLFAYMPGFSMFRDPTKWYVLVALSFSVLIPWGLKSISQIKRLANFKHIQLILTLIFVGYWLILIRPALAGEFTGTFQQKAVPQEYIELKDYIYDQNKFFRTFWVPQKQRFGFFSNTNPAVEGREIMRSESTDRLLNWLQKDGAQEQLARWGVKYVIVPFDSEGEIFLDDRKYSSHVRNEIVNELDKIAWLSKITDFSDNVVYETEYYNDHFWIEGGGDVESWNAVSPTEYSVTLAKTNIPYTLVFSEHYDKGWGAIANGQEHASNRTKDNLNSFSIDTAGDQEIVVKYKPQRYMNIGIVISLLTALCVILTLAVLGVKHRAMSKK